MNFSSSAQSTNPRWLLGIGSLLLIVLFGSLALNDYLARDTALKLQHENQGRLQALAVQSAVDVKATAERLREGSILWHGFIADITQLMGTTIALRDSESRFRSMVSNLPGVVYRRSDDENRTLNYLSTGIERLTGYPASDFIAPSTRSYLSLVHPDDLAQVQQADSNFELTYRLINARGQVIWVQDNRRALRDVEGVVLWYDGFIWDVTQRILAEQALRASQEHLSSLYRLAPVGIMLSRLEDGQLLDWNPELQRVSGYSPEQLINCNVLRLLPDPRNGHGTVKQLLQKGSYGPRETLLVRLDGKQVPVLLNGTLITGSDGSLLVWSIVQDITARAAAESEAREREAYLRLLIANVVDAIIIDASDTIETFNHAAERIFGYDEKDIIGQNVSILMPAGYRSSHSQYLSAAEKRGGQHVLEQNRELVGLRRNGETFTIELRVSEIRHDGQCKFIGLVRDITERKRIERLKSDFVSVVSHELRTPLTSIAGALGLMTGGALGEIPEAIRQMLDIAQQNSQRLGLLIDDLLDMDKLIAGKMCMDMHVQPLTPLLLEAMRSNQGYFDQYSVRGEIGELAEVLVSVDSNRLQQVLANFLSNAAKFSPSGGVVVLSSHRLDDHVQVSVTDQGPGGPPSFREHIFQKFSQADSSDTRQKGGTGLGLAIRKGLIEHMHGRIGFDTERTHGTRFWFELPVHES